MLNPARPRNAKSKAKNVQVWTIAYETQASDRNNVEPYEAPRTPEQKQSLATPAALGNAPPGNHRRDALSFRPHRERPECYSRDLDAFWRGSPWNRHSGARRLHLPSEHAVL